MRSSCFIDSSLDPPPPPPRPIPSPCMRGRNWDIRVYWLSNVCLNNFFLVFIHQRTHVRTRTDARTHTHAHMHTRTHTRARARNKTSILGAPQSIPQRHTANANTFSALPFLSHTTFLKQACTESTWQPLYETLLRERAALASCINLWKSYCHSVFGQHYICRHSNKNDRRSRLVTARQTSDTRSCRRSLRTTVCSILSSWHTCTHTSAIHSCNTVINACIYTHVTHVRVQRHCNAVINACMHPSICCFKAYELCPKKKGYTPSKWSCLTVKRVTRHQNDPVWPSKGLHTIKMILSDRQKNKGYTPSKWSCLTVKRKWVTHHQNDPVWPSKGLHTIKMILSDRQKKMGYTPSKWSCLTVKRKGVTHQNGPSDRQKKRGTHQNYSIWPSTEKVLSDRKKDIWLHNKQYCVRRSHLNEPRRSSECSRNDGVISDWILYW